jgi:hypothetical protein
MFGLVQGGGTTGQAEALTLAVAKALLVHEPALKPVLRRGESDTFHPPTYARYAFPLAVYFCLGSVNLMANCLQLVA